MKKILSLYNKIYSTILLNILDKIGFLENKSNLDGKVRVIFDKLDLDYDKSINTLNSYFSSVGRSAYNSKFDSVHFLFFAALEEKKLKIYNILEFGTYLGETTKYLSKLFKNSDIYTIDLPNNDPLLKDTYSRDDNKSFETYTRVQSENLMNKNIYSYSLNTLFLGCENRIISKKYDLIWLDAGHNFPEIAWDFSYALSLVSKQGFIVIDDVILNNKVFKTDYVSNHSFLLIDYLKKRLDIEIDFILKRSCPKRFYHINTRKYIAIIKFKS